MRMLPGDMKLLPEVLTGLLNHVKAGNAHEQRLVLSRWNGEGRRRGNDYAVLEVQLPER